MSEVGVNIANHGDPDTGRVAALGARWVRLVLVPSMYPSSLIQRYKAAGLKVLGVLARESFPGGGTDYAAMVTMYARVHGNDLSAWQVGNEPDHVSDSSWTLSQDEYAALLKQCHSVIARTHPDAEIVGAGGASGNPDYFRRGDILRYLDGISCHPYGQDGDVVKAPSGNFGKASDLIGRYYDLGLPVWVTEYGTDSRDDRKAALYVGDLTRQFKADPRVRVACHFCLHDLMVPGFGLFNVGGIKPQGVAYTAALGGAGGSPVATLEERVAQLEKQQSLQSEAIAQILADHYQDGPQSAKGLLVQLNSPKYTPLQVVEKQSK